MADEPGLLPRPVQPQRPCPEGSPGLESFAGFPAGQVPPLDAPQQGLPQQDLPEQQPS